MGKAKAKWTYVGPVKSANVYQLKITIYGSRPPIWRRLLVRDDASLEELHQAIQLAFDWADCHLHEFQVGDRRFMPTSVEGFDPFLAEGVKSEESQLLSDLRLKEKSKFVYTYDMGDNWEHIIVVEKIHSGEEAEALMAKATTFRPTVKTRMPVATCLAGARSGPFEDSGGIWGYEETCQILADPRHPEHAERSEWATEFASNCTGKGVRFDPERFELNAINKALHKYLKR